MPAYLSRSRLKFIAATVFAHLILACGWAYGPIAGVILAVLLAALAVSCVWIGVSGEQLRSEQVPVQPVRDWDRADA